jgi:glycerophosphoryl diester phosphodiesterase
MVAAVLLVASFSAIVARHASLSLAQSQPVAPSTSRTPIPTPQYQPDSHYVAHAGGAYLGKTYTNSIAAFDRSYQAGYRLFETDLNLTTDGHIVLLHDWDNTFTYVFGLAPGRRDLQTILTQTSSGPIQIAKLDDLVIWLSAHKDAKIILDSKADAIQLLTQVAKRYPGLRSRFIAYIYNFEQYQPVADLGYTNISLIVYEPYSPSELNTFAQEHKLYSMVMTPGIFYKQSTQLSQTVNVYCWTINDALTRDSLMKAGAYGIITDSLIPPAVGE